MKRHYAALILFLEGLASSGLQMITIRQTVPFVGSSILTTSIVISFFLAALALGYFVGGKRKADTFSKALIINTLLSVAIFGIGLSYVFVSLFFDTLNALTQQTPLLNNPLIHLSIFCLCVMSPLVFLLGQTVPLLLNTAKIATSKSEAAGNATSISTIGNVVGCIFTPLILMSLFGVGVAIFVNCLVLILCIFIMTRFRSLKVLIYSVTCIGLTYLFNVTLMNALYLADTPYANYFVDSNSKGNTFIVNRSLASYIDHQTKQGWPYIETIKQAVASNSDIQNILILGAGGFTLSADNDFFSKKKFTYVDVDPAIKKIAQSHFLNGSINGSFVAEDARFYLIKNKQLWDMVVVDLYTNASTIPSHTVTKEFFELVSQRIDPNGLAAINIVANPTLKDNYSYRIDRTIRSAFNSCITDIQDFKNQLTNIIYFCQPSPSKESVVYRDDNTRASIDGFIAKEAK